MVPGVDSQSKVRTPQKRELDVPVTNFSFEYYDVIVVYMAPSYTGPTTNLVYMYSSVGTKVKRDTTSVVWIYPTGKFLICTKAAPACTGAMVGFLPI